jgi:hypothetical protein
VSDPSRLAGNGAELVRERALAKRVQVALERMYRIERVADVGDFLRGADGGEREALLMREADDGAIELMLRLPQLGPHPDAGGGGPAERGPGQGNPPLDAFCQIIEGVSHFVYVAERARTKRETTHLELELQAEVDKWVVLAASIRAFDIGCSAALRARLYEQVSFEHDKQTELGERYRVANDAAHRFVRRLERDYVGHERYPEMRTELRHFFHVGQEEKLRLGRAA